MANPVGYLYSVGRNYGRRSLARRRPDFDVPAVKHFPEIEPGLADAVGQLSERQRLSVVLVHCFQWTLSEVADLLEISKSAVQTHLERGMANLRDELGVEQ